MKRIFALVICAVALLDASLPAQYVWMQQNNPFGSGDTAMLGKIQFVSASEGWISGRRGTLLHTTNGGSDWATVTPFPSDTVWSISDPSFNMWFINPTTGWILKSAGTRMDSSHGVIVYKTADAGKHWQRTVITQNAGDVAAQIQFADANTGWASTYNTNTAVGVVYKTIDGGATWSLLQTLPRTDETIIFNFVDAKVGWLTSINDNPTRFRISKSVDGGLTWNAQFTDTTANADTTTSSGAMQFLDANHGWVAGSNGRVLKTANGGATWDLLTNTGLSKYANCKCLFFLDTLNGWIGANVTLPNQPSTHVVIHTANGGKTWAFESLPPAVVKNDVFSICFSDLQHGWISGDLGMLARAAVPTSVDDRGAIPIGAALSQNYPNPFNPSTTITYTLPMRSHVRLQIYDLLGRIIAELVDADQTAGMHRVRWNAHAASGMYFYTMEAVDMQNPVRRIVDVRKMTLMR